MPWLHTETYPLPEEDLISFTFGNDSYDQDKPVSYFVRDEAAPNTFLIKKVNLTWSDLP